MRTRSLICRLWVGLLFILLSAACSSALPARQPTATAAPPTLPALPSVTAAVSATPLPSATATPAPPTAAPSETPTNTALPEPSVTATFPPPPPTASGDSAIYIYLIQTGGGGEAACGDSVMPVNTGAWRTGDMESDVRTSLERLFVKQQYIAGLTNPAYLSNIQVGTVNYKAFQGIIEIRLSGTYVRSGERCDDRRVRAQVWGTIRQFSGIKTIDILLNGNLLGDILAGGQ